MSVHDDLTSVQRCLDDLQRSVRPPGTAPRRRTGDAPGPRRRRPPARERRAAARGEHGATRRARPPGARGPRRGPTWWRSPTPPTTARCGPTPTTRGSARTTAPPTERPRHGHPPEPDRSPTLATGTEPHPNGGGVRTGTRAAITAPHLRTDRWWLAPAVTAAGLLAFVVYSTWRAFADARLLRGAVRLAVLLALSGRAVPDHARRAERGPLRQLVGHLPRDPHPGLPAGLPADLLLLPQGLLPGLLGVAHRPARSPSRTGSTPARPASR